MRTSSGDASASAGVSATHGATSRGPFRGAFASRQSRSFRGGSKRAEIPQAKAEATAVPSTSTPGGDAGVRVEPRRQRARSKDHWELDDPPDEEGDCRMPSEDAEVEAVHGDIPVPTMDELEERPRKSQRLSSIQWDTRERVTRDENSVSKELGEMNRSSLMYALGPRPLRYLICEVFSPPRITARARERGKAGGWSIDNAHVDPITEKKYDLRSPACEARVRELIKRDQPHMVSLSFS